MRFLNTFFTYRWMILSYIVVFNMALLIKFLYDEKWIGNKSDNNIKISNLLKKKNFNSKAFKNLEEIKELGAFLLKHSDELMSYHLQPQLKPFKRDDGSYTLYKKDGKTFYFNQSKEIYQFVPEKLRDSLQMLWNRAGDNLLSAFVMEIPPLGYSIDSSKYNLKVYLKVSDTTRENFIGHSLYFNRKYHKKLSLDSTAGDYLVKDTLLKPNIRYVITALVNLDK